MSTTDQKHRCKAKTRAGKPCQAAATAGGLCFFHANPNKASELGRIGGRSNRQDVIDTVDPLPKMDNAVAVRDVLAQLIADVHAGRIQPRVAAGLAPLLSLQLRAIELADRKENFERRISELEKQLPQVDNDSVANTSMPKA